MQIDMHRIFQSVQESSRITGLGLTFIEKQTRDRVVLSNKYIFIAAALPLMSKSYRNSNISEWDSQFLTMHAYALQRLFILQYFSHIFSQRTNLESARQKRDCENGDRKRKGAGPRFLVQEIYDFWILEILRRLTRKSIFKCH